jgi:hypothetical protein
MELLKGYIRSRKMKISIGISIFTTLLCILYVGSYLLASKIYQDALFDFDILNTISTRSPCPARALYFMQDDYLRNSSRNITSINAVPNLLNECLEVENRMRDL